MTDRQARTLLFKIGDRVRLHDKHPSHTDEVGVISGATLSPSRQQIYFVEWENWNIDMLFWFETELELVEAAADAVGRGRVSEAIDEALDDLCIAAIAFGSPSAGKQASANYLAARMRVRALLTAAPAERGHDETGEKP